MCLHVTVQAQRTILELQAQLDILKDSESLQADTEDIAQLKVGQLVLVTTSSGDFSYSINVFGILLVWKSLGVRQPKGAC